MGAPAFSANGRVADSSVITRPERWTDSRPWPQQRQYLPLDELIDDVIDPLVTFHIAHPGFQALFTGSIVSPRLASAVEGFLDAVVRRAEVLFAVRAPHLPPDRRARCARVSVELVRALLPLIVATDPHERDAMIAELKAVQRGYLAPLLAGAAT